MTVMPDFSDAVAWRAWMQDEGPDGYKAQVRRLCDMPKAPPREDWPVNYGELIDRHRALAGLAINEAARHAKEAIRLAAEQVGST